MAQKRSENTYQKINTIFKRDANNIIMPYDGYVDPALEFLKDCKFECTEKVDGTNVRIELHKNVRYEEVEGSTDFPVGVDFEIAYCGKTDNAQLPSMLEKFMRETYPLEKVCDAFGLKAYIPKEEWADHKWNTPEDIPDKYTIYGEGYGAKIQAGGNYLKDSNKVIGFDVKIGDVYLLSANRDDILTKLGMPIVPLIGYFTIPEAIEYVRLGFKSLVAENNKDYLAEGLVCKTPIGLRNRNGERIVFKVKTCDWVKYYNKYHTYDKVEQPVNTNYNK